MAVDRPSWTANLSAALGLCALLGVLCFHFPELLTSRELRQLYTESFVRNLLLGGLVAAFLLGTLAVLRGRQRRVALLGVGSAALALLLGGATVPFDTIRPTAFSLGLDWFVLSLFFSALVFVPIETLLAQRPQSPLRPEWRTDLGYFFIGHVLVQFVLIAVTASTTFIAGIAAFPPLQAAIQALPTPLQFLLAVFVADLTQALLHRAYHRVPLLWRFHAVHHSSRHLDWLAGSRMHLVEILLTRCTVLAPLVVLGFAPGVVNAYVILVGLQAVLAHANLGLRFGWLEHLLVLPRYHHWHHARDAEHIDCNYAIHLPLIDRLLGTHRLPPEDRWPREYGVMETDSVPRGLWAQTVQPFLPARRPSTEP